MYSTQQLHALITSPAAELNKTGTGEARHHIQVYMLIQ